ncbi:unnamed protein product [Pelagomonas calceolata]|uniref:Uncharacterized protein n=3 Tax=Pelagomonas calceolata TaxID=35677 RepID=A0A8J2WWL0_9STRA|nr:unnamed protein product [Pelagomonas calceolata]
MRWILAALLCAGTRATGKGPVGIYVIDDRYAAVADSNANALLIVDVLRGGVAGSRRWPSPKNDTKEWYSLTGVASCANCSFAYLTTNHGPAFWRMDLTKPLAALAHADDFADLARATLVELPCLRSLDANTRMVALKRDGSVGFVALKAAGVAAFAPRAIHASAKRCDSLNVRLVASKDAMRGGKTFAGLALSRDDATLYVTAENGVFSIRATGTFQKRAEKLTGEPACGLHNVHLRETAPQNGHLYVVGHPSADNAGMAVYRLGKKKGACALVAGDVNKHEDWRDGAGAAARFSRPHQMAAFRANELLLTDIDNRAVRRITLADGRASTVPYDNNHLYTELWRLGGPQRHDHGQYVYPLGDRFPSTHATPLSEADRNRDVGVDPAPDNESATAAAAAAACAARGAALCPPAALRDDGVLGRLRRSAAWTSQSCHSCWLHWPGECPRPKAHEQAKKRTSAAWGAGYQMVARVGAGDVRFECTDVKKKVGTRPLCCSSSNGPAA